MSLMYIEVLVSQKANKPCMRLVLQRIEEVENTKNHSWSKGDAKWEGQRKEGIVKVDTPKSNDALLWNQGIDRYNCEHCGAREAR
jgi:hypothetical protein